MDNTVLVLTTVVITVIVIINLIVYGSQSRAESVIKNLIAELEKNDERILIKDIKAVFFGLKSLGRGQIRGNGVAVLTGKKVYFSRYFPAKHISIPLEKIDKIETAQGYLGKNVYMKTLKLGFGKEELEFHVSDLKDWLEELDKAQLKCKLVNQA